MNILIEAFKALYGFVAKGKVNALITMAIVVVFVVLVVGSGYFVEQTVTGGGGGGVSSFYKQPPSLRVVDPPVSIGSETIDVISVVCATDAIPEINYIIDWLRLSNGAVEDAIFSQALKAPLDTDCTPVPTELGIPRGVRPGTWHIRITIDTGLVQRTHNSQAFEVIP